MQYRYRFAFILWTVWLAGLVMPGRPAAADGIVADGAAPTGQRPHVVTTQNGLPQVNIAAPDQGGLSHNRYLRFDVDRRGAILNNSATMTSTGLAGMIQGNPNFGPNGATARVILNEINSSNPSVLRGFMEVAGDKAQVIVANPSGIVCDGCGTINAGRMTLSTGSPQRNADGSLAGFRVERGVVRIEGGGLNGDARHDTAYVDILARAVEINAGVWARDAVSVIAGRNRVSADAKTVAPLGAETMTPQLAIDMGQLGGMYSGHIRMIGTEAGVGVRNQGGHLQAAGTLTVSSEGRLSWLSGSTEAVTQAGGDISLAARDGLEHHGKLYGGGALSVASRTGNIEQSGTLAAAGDVRLTAGQGIQSRGNLLAGSDINSSLTRMADLVLTSQQDVRASGNLLSRKSIDIKGNRIDLSQGTLAADQLRIHAQDGEIALRQTTIDSRRLALGTTGAIDAQQAKVRAGSWRVGGNSLLNQAAVWTQVEDGESRFALTGALDNSGGVIEARQLELDAGSLDNRQGRLVMLGGGASHGRIAGLLDNRGGELGGNGDLALSAASMDNRSGMISSAESLDVVSGGDFHNGEGTLRVGKGLKLNAQGVLDNASGMIAAAQVDVTAQRVRNRQGQLIGQGDLRLTTRQALDNAQGWLEAGRTLSVQAGGHWDNRDATALGGEQVRVTVDGLDNTAGRLQSGGDLRVGTFHDLVNRQGILTAGQALTWQGGAASLLDNGAGSLQSGGAMSLTGGALRNLHQGVVLSQQALALTLDGTLDNQGGMLTGHGQTAVRAGQLRNAQGSIQSLASLDLWFAGALDNRDGRIFSRESQRLHAQDILNTQGWMGSQGEWSAVGGAFSNRDGSIQTLGDATLAANALDNGKGALRSAANLTLRVAQDIDNQAGDISVGGRLDVQGAEAGARAGALNNAAGRISTGAGLALAAQGLDNTRQGLIHSERQLRLDLGESLDNRDGHVQSGEALQLDARQVLNEGGAIDSQRELDLRIVGRLGNDRGAVRSNGDQRIVAARVGNRAGVFSSRGALAVVADHLNNADGMFISQGAGDYRVAMLDNRQGKMHSGDALTLNSEQLDNQAGQLVATRTFLLDAARLDNSGRGNITSQERLNITADWLNNSDGGLLLGAIHTGVAARSVDNTSGRLQSVGSLTLSGLASLDNRQGSIQANGALRIQADEADSPSALFLFNQDGLVESAGTLAIDAHALDNRAGTLRSQDALSLSIGQDYTHQAGDTISSNAQVTLAVDGTLTNQAEWLLPGDLVVHSTHLTNQGSLAARHLQVTTGALRNQGRLEADRMALDVDTLDNAASVMGDDVAVRGRVIDNHGRDGVVAATQQLSLQARERLSNRDGSLLYSGGALNLGSGDLLENRASVIEADGDVAIEAKRLENLREGLVIARDAQTDPATKWQRYNYYWRSYGSKVNPDLSSVAPTTQRLTFQDEDAAKSNPYGTLLAIDAPAKRAQLRVRNRWGKLTDLWVNYLALVPGADGSYAMTFYETRGHRQGLVPTPYQNTVWREFDWGRLEQWDPERHVDIAAAPFVTDYSNFRERTVTSTVTRDSLVSEGTGARILAGGDMALRISGSLLNDASVITANGNLDIPDDGVVDNRGYSVNERRQEIIVDHYDKDTVHWYPTFNRDVTTALSTVDGVISGNGNVTIRGASITNTTVAQAQISDVAAAFEAVQAERAEWERNPLAVTVPDADRIDGDTQLAGDRPLLPAEQALTQKRHLRRVATSIPDNGLFRQPAAQDSPYLVVTDARFTSRSGFISSDYLLKQVGFDPARAHKRLGDGFYEQRLVREQVLQLTGRPSVRGESAMDQYQALMANGAKTAQDLQLVPGVALTPAQIAALQQDIVWMVSESVDTATGPQTVWVPKVYLAASTLRLTGDGALVGGGALQLSAGSVDNAGNLFADRALGIDADQFLHRGGDIKADRIDIQANHLAISSNLQDALRQASMSATDIALSGGDIRFRGARLDATHDLNLSARDSLDIGVAQSRHTASVDVISGAMGNRTRSGMETAGQRMAQVSGEWQQSQGSGLKAGNNVSVTAGRDLVLQGSQVVAGGSAHLQAEGDVRLSAASTTNTTRLKAGSSTSSVDNQREEQRLSLASVSGDKGVTVLAGNAAVLEGAQVDSRQGHISLEANDVSVGSARRRVTDRDVEHTRDGKTKGWREMESSRNEATGSTLSGQDGITIVARTGDIAVKASTLHSEQGDLALQARQDVRIASSTESETRQSREHAEKKGFLRKSSSDTVKDDRMTREAGSVLSGDRVSIVAGNDLTVTGSAIVGDRDVNLRAGRDVDISAATETESHYLLEKKKKSGLLDSGGIGFTLGNQSSRHEADEHGVIQSQSASTIGSTQGNVTITAENRVHVRGADLVAGMDLDITGDSVRIDPGYDERTRHETFESKQRGLTIALSGTVGSALNTAVSAARQAGQESDGRLRALQGAKAALSGVQAAQALERDDLQTQAADAKNTAAGLSAGDKDAAQGATNTIGVNISYGSQSSKTETRSESRRAQGSTLNAGRDISITATGAGRGAGSGDVVLAGTQVKAGGDVLLSADRDIELLSARNVERIDGTSSSHGGNVGIGIGAGAGGYGINVSAGVNAGKGREKGRGLTHTETTLDAGGTVMLASGRDTLLKGAQVGGEYIEVNADRNLTLQSEQDSDHYSARQRDISAGGSFSFGSMSGTANISASQDKLRSDFDSVKEQTGLFAGRGGYDINVGHHTQLDGAVIASTAGPDQNLLDTGTLGWRDIDNRADFQARHSGGSMGTGGPVGKDLLTNAAGGMLSGANHGGHASGTTLAAVSEGGLRVHDQANQRQDVAELNRDAAHANDGSISPIFNKEKEQNRLRQVQLIGEIGSQSMDVIRTQGDIAGLKAQTDPKALAEARAQLGKEGRLYTDADVMDRAYANAMKHYGTGSDLQKAAQAVTGALTALAGDNLAGALGSAAAPYLATEIKRRIGEDNPAANAMAHAVLGAVTAQLNGQSPLAGGLGAGGGELAARVIARQLFPGKDPDALSETEKQQVSALSQLAAGIAGGLATGDAAGGVTGAQAGRNAVENNFLDVVQLEDFAHRAKVGTGEERQKVIRDMVDTNVRQQDEIKEVCAKSPQQCQQRYGYLLDEWELFDDTIKRLAKDKSLPDDFRDYMPAVYMSDVDAGGIVAEHGWTKRFEAMGFDADTARVMAATLPAVVSSVGGGGSKGINKGAGKKSGVGGGVDGILPKDKTTSGGPAALGGSRKEKLINPDNNEAVANHTVVSSGKAPKIWKPNSIYEVSRADGTKSVTYYDDRGRTFSREDYGQQKTHGELGYDENGRVPPHEHRIIYNERGYVDKKYYRELDVNGNPVGSWVLDGK
ncbi:hemagglutinin repeat-containing protein [Achromobacter xylosoxidans]|uniref:hemagglutinin repeat-containing protein n=1 Tax=Alcaligenes xylosoxydans xylosoxydans TaxID=85698 RepID=UPI0006C2AE65|nr:hemagglutinin repeat-containing protein [Achromobacter xylosoxidans]QQE56982.1 hemagglutinin repeat-containing protein [Achromobacter xylosoxidans]QQV16622.1 hemagglutinin repeat-containing protein [Achromobacter xylosoxidans]UXL06757.1 hemagglutinin repeat-containing protein [Achromobacter xylosoxidans]CUI43499.1 Filamentous hemagglutinin [Achromobacter xylosoxidans]